ncbi:MAG: PrsW family glutamic-type intramembrane protease [bacterium]
MSIWTILALAFAPGLFWLWFFYRKDKIEPEPKILIIKVFFWGMVAVFPVSLIETPFAGSQFLLVVIAAPVIEEFAKYFVVRWSIYNNPEFDEPMDGIVYAAAAALGFASTENAFYLLSAGRSSPSPAGAVLSVFVIRSLLAVPGHVLFSTMWGCALGWAKFSAPDRARRLIMKGLLLAVGLHALYNWLVSNVPLISTLMLIFLIGGWRMVNRRITAALEGSPHSASAPKA